MSDTERCTWRVHDERENVAVVLLLLLLHIGSSSSSSSSSRTSPGLQFEGLGRIVASEWDEHRDRDEPQGNRGRRARAQDGQQQRQQRLRV